VQPSLVIFNFLFSSRLLPRFRDRQLRY